MKNTLLICVSAAALMVGCAYPNPGSQPSETPPQLVTTNGVLTWNNPQAFGPVPESMQATAAKACGSLSTNKDRPYEARGFHPKALNQAGTPFVGGGFYCTPKT